MELTPRLLLLIASLCDVGAFQSSPSTPASVHLSQKFRAGGSAAQRFQLNGTHQKGAHSITAVFISLNTHPYSESTLIEKIDALENDMKHHQETTKKMMETLKKDVAMQKMMASESRAAYDRLHLVKDDMVQKLNEARNHYLHEKKEIIRLKDAELAARDAIITNLKAERSSLRHLFRRFFSVLLTKIKNATKPIGRKKET